MRFLVTGGGGFIGSHLTERFLREGHEVVVIDDFSTGARRNLERVASNPNLSLIEGDMGDTDRVREACRGVDAVYHLAAAVGVALIAKQPTETIHRNIYPTQLLLEELRWQHQSGREVPLFLASTSEVYGDPLEHPQKEEYWGNVNPIGLRGVYDEAKRFAEAMTMGYCRYHGVNTHIIRIFNTYGERMRLDDGRVLPNFMGQALRGEPLTIYGDGSQTRSFCYVSDLVEGIWRLLQTDFHEPVNLGNPAEITIRQFAEEILKLSGRDNEIVYRPLPQDDPKVRKPDISRARALLGWEPLVDRDTGLRRTMEFYKQKLAK